MSLKREKNELLTQVCNDAPLGNFLRETQWVPAVLSSSLLPDDPPYPVRLLGDNYVAFRSTDGRVGFFAELCPHRNASLLLARNEDNALRCIFHGWKFCVDGTTLEAPTQPNNQQAFCKRVPLEHYPTREAAGIVWVWLGKGEPGPLPDLEFMDMTDEHVYAVRSIQNFNWVQSLEGLVDSAHVTILHSDWLKRFSSNPKLANAGFDAAPVYEFEDRPNGFRYAAIRNAPEDQRYIRVTEFYHPWFCFIPSDQGSCFICVPIDDENTAFWAIRYHASDTINDSPWKPAPDRMNWPPPLPAGKEKRWGQDREAMKNGSFTGFEEHFLHEDLAVAVSQGTIAKREKEFLNEGDRSVVMLRKILLQTATDFAAGEWTAPATDSSIRVAAGQLLLGPDEDWRDQHLE